MPFKHIHAHMWYGRQWWYLALRINKQTNIQSNTYYKLFQHHDVVNLCRENLLYSNTLQTLDYWMYGIIVIKMQDLQCRCNMISFAWDSAWFWTVCMLKKFIVFTEPRIGYAAQEETSKSLYAFIGMREEKHWQNNEEKSTSCTFTFNGRIGCVANEKKNIW